VALVKSAGRADAFGLALSDAGFVPVLVSPFQREAIPDGESELYDALAYAGALGGNAVWVAVTSSQAVPALEPVTHLLSRARIAAVGGGTATSIHAAGLAADVVGDAGGAALARAMLRAGVGPGSVVLHPCNEGARPELSHLLVEAGADVRPIPVYRMVPDAVGERAARGAFHAVIVSSPRLAHRAAELFPDRPPVVAIGRTTAAALRDLGWAPRVVAASPAPADVAAAVCNVT
jgi:uroporphyrinogen-III synthase